MNYQQSKLDHESFLAKKKAEILAKKNAQKNPASTIIKPSEKPDKSTAPTPKVPFANDGSFLEKFMAMQNAKTSSKPSPVSNQVSSSSKVNVKIEKAEDDQSLVKAKLLAKKVVTEGIEEEARARLEYIDDTDYRFLFEPTSCTATFYRDEIKRLNNETKKRKFSDSSSTITRKADIKKESPAKGWYDQPQKSDQYLSATNSSILAANRISASILKSEPSIKNDPVFEQVDATSSYTSASGYGRTQLAVKKEETPVNPLTEFEKAKALMRAKAAAMLSGNNVSGFNEEEERKNKEIEEQKLMNNIYTKVIAQQLAAEEENSKKKIKRKSDHPKYDYDSDEDVEGGTWEHKKRKSEMEKTQEWALDLTSGGKGKHHIADFLPPDELEKFLEKVTAVREGREADFSDYSKYRIQSDNLGYKMLQKAGWQEGEGLGSKKEGIVAPINKGKVSFDHTGVGSEKPAEVKKDDSDFDLYRKRMMLAYKFRPNPLNNPRRPYYS